MKKSNRSDIKLQWGTGVEATNLDSEKITRAIYIAILLVAALISSGIFIFFVGRMIAPDGFYHPSGYSSVRSPSLVLDATHLK